MSSDSLSPARRKLVVAAAAMMFFAYSKGAHMQGHGGGVASLLSSASAPLPAAAVQQAIGFAKDQAQHGCPYAWGGTGPCDAGFDCSGLTMDAYASAGVSIPRTSEAQWTWGVQNGKTVPWDQREAGDLVFFPGSDGTPQAPGHVVMLVNRNHAIQAYASGYPVMITPVAWGEAGAVVGVVRPTAGA